MDAPITNGAKAMVAALTLLALGAQPLSATGKQQWPTFRQADRDASGALSLDEVRDMPVLADDFALHDKNSDGRLSRAEFEAAKRAGTAGNTGRAAGTGARR